MKKQHIVLPSILALFLVLTLVQCKSSASVPKEEMADFHDDFQGELHFFPQILPDLTIPGEAGALIENPAEQNMLRNAFREAYLETLLRGIVLTGVLGGDRVSPWPASEPESWSQNWTCAENSPEAGPNTWGIPNLVLAIGNYDDFSRVEKVHIPVFTVYGQILDMYGRSAGYNRANGVTGYGIPLGEVFFSESAAIQRFSRGKMIIDREGSRFSFGQDDLPSLVENLGPEERNREFGGQNIPVEVSNAFAYAWAFALSMQEKEWNSDGPVVLVTLPSPWTFQAERGEITINGFFYKSYNKGNDMLVLAESAQLPLRVHRLSGPVLKTILSGKRLPGLETRMEQLPLEESSPNFFQRIVQKIFPRRNSTGGSARSGRSSGSTGLSRSLTEGFAIYGPPVSDPLPRPNNAGGETGESLFLEAQRFARGWIVVQPERLIPKVIQPEEPIPEIIQPEESTSEIIQPEESASEIIQSEELISEIIQSTELVPEPEQTIED